MKVLSIIIPTYNTELYIERCLDSLLYNDKIIKYLDIIIVNDGSSAPNRFPCLCMPCSLKSFFNIATRVIRLKQNMDFVFSLLKTL